MNSENVAPDPCTGKNTTSSAAAGSVPKEPKQLTIQNVAPGLSSNKPLFSDEDTLSISVESQSTTLWLVSTYMAYDRQDCPPARLLDVVKEANSKKLPIVIGAAANAHHAVKSLIGYLDITAENYDTALAALIERYNNKRALFSKYMKKVVNQPIIFNDSADELQTLVSRACVFALQNLIVDTEKYGFRTLEALYPQATATKNDPNQISSVSSTKQPNSSSSKPMQRKDARLFNVSAKRISCPKCGPQGPHLLQKRPSFLQMSASERKSTADQLKVCINCLGHPKSQACISEKTCFTCRGKQHTLLHLSNFTSSASNQISSSTSNKNISKAAVDLSAVAANNLVNSHSSSVLLATALVNVPYINGQFVRLRALIDQGSQHAVITERAAQRLKLPTIPICVGVRPMGQNEYKIINKELILNINSITDFNFSVETTASISNTITSDLPLFLLKSSSFAHIQHFPLADPHFASPGQIDLLLAGDVYFKILQSGLCKGQPGEPVAQNTSLGWILGGEVYQQNY
ncbi:uncharacterized protein LOC118749550 [Rhagoletis pomonella]|uniref:uncharacterized protein LOC118749550 n=1 Tax=Rhagoletis pomonella TaxID=28610 RepID=UPI0017848297|nr:uncharacterized protein LOC118749550 [Rhagoletis pomonella]